MDASPSHGEQNSERRSNKPVASIVAVVMLLIYAACFYYVYSGAEIAWCSAFKAVAFEVLLCCAGTTLLLTLYNKILLDRFYQATPKITQPQDIAALKPIVRINMYSSLLNLLLLYVGAAAAFFTLYYQTGYPVLFAVLMTTVLSLVMKWYTPAESRVKQLTCDNAALEHEFNALLNCWLNNALPNFK